MNSKQQRVNRIAQNRRAEIVRATPALPANPTAEDDAHQLAREAHRAFAAELEKYRRLGSKNVEDPRESPEKFIQAIVDTPPQDATFFQIEQISRVDPAKAVARWEEIKATARGDLESGLMAARALEYLGGSAWERATYLAVRDRLVQAWSPRHAGEMALLEEMAQYEVTRMQWMRIVSMWSRDPRIQTSMRDPGYHQTEKRHQTYAEANMEAMRMVERLQKLYQNALRMLLDSRRGKSSFIVNRAKQMNFAAGPQMNVVKKEDGSDS
jgi:hypothetical protein